MKALLQLTEDELDQRLAVIADEKGYVFAHERTDPESKAIYAELAKRQFERIKRGGHPARGAGMGR